ncbi:MAG: hypothetical protein PHU12_00185 [Candidatus Aenigmarchaeota archaeon]|nr:hypothetical protein [Candidatus Aenigmarchaeota archaeon]
MKITLCSSMTFIENIACVGKILEEKGHMIFLPIMTNFKEETKRYAEHSEAKISHDLIREHFKKIDNSEAILVLNYDKNGIKGYIGGNSFLEMGKAYDNGIKIFLLNPIPKMSYTDEIIAMQPIVIHGNLELIK